MTTVRRAAAAVALATVALVAGTVTGCSGPAEPAPSSGPAPAPFLIDQDFPDPDVIAADGHYVAFATNSQGVNVQFATSDDLRDWTVSLDDALPELPRWATSGRTWAPEVSALPSGGYVMYFTAEHAASGRQCIGAATSDEVTGPFVAVGGDPIVCPLDEGGAIDAAFFTDDDGTPYLLWKNDGNCCGLDTWIQIAPLSADGTQLAGPATKLFAQSEKWEGALVEAPTLLERDGRYLVLYSANDYGSDRYAVGVATSSSLLGPYEKSPEPLLSTSAAAGRYLGPGGQDVVTTPDGDKIVFHSWDEFYIYRGLQAVPLDWDGAAPSVRFPTSR